MADQPVGIAVVCVRSNRAGSLCPAFVGRVCSLPSDIPSYMLFFAGCFGASLPVIRIFSVWAAKGWPPLANKLLFISLTLLCIPIGGVLAWLMFVANRDITTASMGAFYLGGTVPAMIITVSEVFSGDASIYFGGGLHAPRVNRGRRKRYPGSG